MNPSSTTVNPYYDSNADVEQDHNWSGGKKGTGTYIGSGNFGADGKAKPIAPAPLAVAPIKKASTVQYDSVLSTFKPDANNYVDSVGKHMADAKKYAADNGYEFDQNEYNNAMTRKTTSDNANQKLYGLGTSTITGGAVKDMYANASGGGQSIASMGDAVLKNAVTNGATTTQLAAALQNINPNLKPEQVADFIAQNNLPYVVNPNGTISAKPAGGVTGGDLTTTGTTGTGGGSTTSTNTTQSGAGNGVSTYNAAQTEVDPTKTTQGLMSSLLDEDSAYIKRARALSMEKMNERGLASSSMAQGAGVAAAIDAALGIAGPDAQIYNRTALDNTGAKNQAWQFNAGANNALNLQNNAQAFTASRDDKLQGFDLAKMDKAQQNNLQTLGTQFGFDLQKMDKAAGTALGQMAVQQQNDVAKMALANGYNLQTMSAQQVNDLGKMAQAQTYVKENLATNQAFDITKMDKAAALTLTQMDRQQLNTLANMATQHGYNMQTLSSQQAAAMAQIGANAETSKVLAALNIDATKQLRISDQEFNTFTNKSNQAFNIMRDLQNGLTGIDQNPNFTDAGAKTVMKDNLVKSVRGSLAVTQMVLNDSSLTALMDSIFDGVPA